MKKTGVFVNTVDREKLLQVARQGWLPWEMMIFFSVGEGIRKDQATFDAKKVCHQLALDYGLPEIPGFYGINLDGEFVSC